MFEDLPALQVDEASLHGLGQPGGPCDVGVEFADDEDGAVAAVWPFFGQFIAHDITADRSPLGHRADPEQIRNFRTPRANLEGLYGAGPGGSPYLYAKLDPAMLLLGASGIDVPRNQEGIALVGDPRNDVHLFVNQIQVAFIKLHNRLVTRTEDIPEAIAEAAAGIIVVHNHPSGDPTPSAEDRGVTQQLAAAGRLLDLPLYDHVIIAGDRFLSFATAGLL